MQTRKATRQDKLREKLEHCEKVIEAQKRIAVPRGQLVQQVDGR